MAKMTLDRILQKEGFGSRRECRNLIAAGAVSVGGVVAEAWVAQVEAQDLVIEVSGESWTCRDRLVLALNKPQGVECSRKPSHHPSVMTLFPPQYSLRGLQPAGRLDHDTTGLLLFSDDGQFIHAHTSPKRHVTRTYVATTAEPVTPELVAAIKAGVQLDDEPAPIAALDCAKVDERRLRIVLTQGKYHQVKRMLAAAGNHCEALARTAIGALQLESLGIAPGEWCHLDAAQLALLQEETTA
jgi:16S rRNA pseudouridine516 synthase